LNKKYKIDDFNYVGTIAANAYKTLTLNIPIRYVSVIVGEFIIDLDTIEEDTISMDFFITYAEIIVSVSVHGSNLETLDYDIPAFYGIGDPSNLLDQWCNYLADRIQEIQIREMMKYYYSTIQTPGDITISNIPTGVKYSTDPINLEPGTTGISIAAILPSGTQLKELTVIIGSTIVSTISTLTMPGYALLFIGNLDIIQPQTATVTIESASPPEPITLHINVISSTDSSNTNGSDSSDGNVIDTSDDETNPQPDPIIIIIAIVVIVVVIAIIMVVRKK
jgi:hypothetical protein